MELSDYRAQIDRIDAELLQLFAERMQTAAGIAAYKKEHALPVLDTGREREKLAGIVKAAPEDLQEEAVSLFRLLFSLSRGYQHSLLGSSSTLPEILKRAVVTTPQPFPTSAAVACQGVEGAYSQLTAEKFFRHPDIRYMQSFEDVFQAVEDGEVDYGVLPIENSTAGSVNKVFDLMGAHEFSIVRSTRVKVDHCLLAKKGAHVEGIRDIYSHEQAIRQCAAFLETLPEARVHVCENTAVAARMVADAGRDDVAALSSRSCAELYGLSVLGSAVQDRDNNYTRFACISKKLEIYPGADRSSMTLVTPHQPGSLYKLLAKFYALDINVVKLESRPIPERDFDFGFYFDIDCPVASDEFRALMSTIEGLCQDFRYLGSYSEVI